MIDKSFISCVANLLAETESGLTGSEVCKFFEQFAVKYSVSIPHNCYPFSKPVSNKRQAFRENLEQFEPKAQYQIIHDLCLLEKFKDNQQVKNLLLTLTKDYPQYAPSQLNEAMQENVQQLRYWLDHYPEAKKQYESALEKKNHQLYQRNLLDDLRLSLELLVKQIFSTDTSLKNNKEKTKNKLGEYLKSKLINKEIRNLSVSIFDYFFKYQNEKVKHNDKSNQIEINFIFNQTTILMLFLIQLDQEKAKLSTSKKSQLTIA